MNRRTTSHTDCHTYQLRAYLYQARDMYSSDKSGLSDPYAVMSFGRYSTRSRIIKESVCPTWDQTMLINQIRMYGDPPSVLETPPPVVIEFYDKDIVVSRLTYMSESVVKLICGYYLSVITGLELISLARLFSNLFFFKSSLPFFLSFRLHSHSWLYSYTHTHTHTY